MLLANYFFMSETLISSLSALQNSIHLNRDTTRSQDSQDVKECFTNSVRTSTQPTFLFLKRVEKWLKAFMLSKSLHY
jgi:hypothetical protein